MCIGNSQKFSGSVAYPFGGGNRVETAVASAAAKTVGGEGEGDVAYLPGESAGPREQVAVADDASPYACAEGYL